MTISELLESIGELLARIAFAFTRTFNLVTEGKLGDLVLSDLGTIVVAAAASLAAVFALLVVFFALTNWLDNDEGLAAPTAAIIIVPLGVVFAVAVALLNWLAPDL